MGAKNLAEIIDAEEIEIEVDGETYSAIWKIKDNVFAVYSGKFGSKYAHLSKLNTAICLKGSMREWFAKMLFRDLIRKQKCKI